MRKWFFFLFLCPSVVLAGEQWDWSERVQYQENHDPSMVWLTDGRKIQVEYSAIPWQTVDKWPRGNPLLLRYNAESGVVLFDPDSQKALPVLRGLDKHPIDLIVGKCLGQNDSTTGMVDCYGRGHDLWDKELNRSYKALIESLGDDQKKKVKEAQQQWLQFRDAQIAAIGAIYHGREGTLWRIVAAEQFMNVVKEQAQRLYGFRAW
jgi:uncharacterized protein YecT (DUF1311 family)